MKKNQKILAVNVNWMNHKLTEEEYAHHFKRCHNATDKKQNELVSKGFGQHKRKEFKDHRYHPSKSTWSANINWFDPQTEVHSGPIPSDMSNEKIKQRELGSTIFEKKEKVSDMLNPTLNELNKFVNNKNSEKRRVNHLFSDVNGKEFTDVKIIPAEVRPITTSITDFSSMSDWCSAESELLRKKVVEYESPVSKNTSLAMSSIIPLPE